MRRKLSFWCAGLSLITANFVMVTREFAAGRFNRELPVDFDAPLMTFGDQGKDLSFDMISANMLGRG
ncbi:MAG: hypothetical protein HC812_14690 [Leptolyngbya sp. RL_3_1]|nr:hypothetical protein [Leptolyngbya sp. RL_3_1]